MRITPATLVEVMRFVDPKNDQGVIQPMTMIRLKRVIDSRSVQKIFLDFSSFLVTYCIDRGGELMDRLEGMLLNYKLNFSLLNSVKDRS